MGPGGNGAHGVLWGDSAAIPSGKPFRVKGDSERKAIPIGWLFRADGQSEWKVISKGTQGAQGAKGTQGDPGALWGHSVAIPNGKPFRMEGDSEWMADYRLAGPLKEYEISVLQVAF